MIDRVAMTKALAKAIAFKLCGKDEEAHMWGMILLTQLKECGILCNTVE